MREKPNPFVSISDLMAGVTAVVMLMLVVMVVRMSVMAEKAEKERKRGVSQTISAIRDSMGEQAYIELDSASGTITLGDAAFERGSACLNESIEITLKQKIAPIISNVLQDSTHSNIFVYIEGHTDNLPVKGISADIKKCALRGEPARLVRQYWRKSWTILVSVVESRLSVMARTDLSLI